MPYRLLRPKGSPVFICNQNNGHRKWVDTLEEVVKGRVKEKKTRRARQSVF
jgi:hypothetical protein